MTELALCIFPRLDWLDRESFLNVDCLSWRVKGQTALLSEDPLIECHSKIVNSTIGKLQILLSQVMKETSIMSRYFSKLIIAVILDHLEKLDICILTGLFLVFIVYCLTRAATNPCLFSDHF